MSLSLLPAAPKRLSGKQQSERAVMLILILSRSKERGCVSAQNPGSKQQGESAVSLKEESAVLCNKGRNC